MIVSVDSQTFGSNAKQLLNIIKSADIGQTEILDCKLFADCPAPDRGRLLAIVERHGVMARFWLPASVEQPGECVLNIHHLLDLARKGSQLRLELRRDDRLDWACGPLRGFAVTTADFQVPPAPALPLVAKAMGRTMTAPIDTCLFRSHIDEDRLYTTITVTEDGRLSASSFDGLRFAVAETSGLDSFTPTKITSETKLLRAVLALCGDRDGKAALYAADRYARLSVGGVSVQWPNLDIVEMLEPLEDPNETLVAPGVTATVSVAEAAAICKAVSKITTRAAAAREAELLVKISKNKIRFQTESSFGASEGDMVASDVSPGRDASVVVNSVHMGEFLTKLGEHGIKSATVKITPNHRLVLASPAASYLLVGGAAE